ncbi:hypothetical protein LMG28614_05845 [Paraburkholderia ultramafica]|uniref:Uncharacterized protein n=1 Tax=Paraburkholderia ultramafica TaxID=1544867 RepID=A0A6S7BM17_9BURK|nr:hypothetical protein [Paraburkholderia ultramafica]CAB3803543.1 hypothetical protein LMG28614_05845 [Paraburkholderia ultramafica]
MREAVDSVAEMRVAVELLAKEWPEEYPAGAVEWLIAASSSGAMSVATQSGR